MRRVSERVRIRASSKSALPFRFFQTNEMDFMFGETMFLRFGRVDAHGQIRTYEKTQRTTRGSVRSFRLMQVYESVTCVVIFSKRCFNR